MKRFLPLLIVSFLFLTSCAQGWNIVFPDSSSELSKKTGTNYSPSSTTSSRQYTYTVSGTLYNSSSSYKYYFTSASGTNTYTLSWENFGTARVAVDVYYYSNFSSNIYSGAVTNPLSLSVTSSRTVYVRVRPANNSSANTGTYNLTLKGNSSSISLTRYN